ncbi:hypothetical protein JVU11DRAFT_1154 [Chiua virens]|nr:hypothetical protein JVU11DRAFT_1154 [Chiua virens]
MFSSKFAAWISVALAGLAHAHIGPYHRAMYAINGTDPANPSLYTGISSNPLYNLKYEEYWMHAIHGVLNFPPPPEDAIEIVPGGTVTLELAENARFTTLSPNAILSDWPDGQWHPNGYSITNLGGASISPSQCISAPNLHAQNESMAAGTALAISYESDPTKVTPNNTVVISVLEHTPFKRIATYQIPEGLPPSNGLVQLLWGWGPRNCGQANFYIFTLLARVVPGLTPAKTLGIPSPLVYCGYGGSNPSKCVKGPKQMIIVKQAEGNNVADADVIDPDGEWAAPGYNPSCGFANGAQNDIFVEAGSPNALFPVAQAAATSPPIVSGSSTSADPASSTSGKAAPTTSGTPTATDLASGKPTPTDPASSASGTPTSTDPGSGTPATTATESGTSTLPSVSSAPTTSQGSCKSTHGGHKRMITRREKHNIF